MVQACLPNHQPRDFNRDSAQTMIEADSARKVMLVVHMEKLALQRDSLLETAFDEVIVVNGGSVYLCKTWEGRLNPERKALTVGVEADGDIVLVSCLSGSNDLGGVQHTSFHMIINGHDHFSGDAVSDLYSPTGGNTKVETAAFNDENARTMAESIAAHTNDTITIQPFSGKAPLPEYQLEQRDKDAIALSMQLARILRELYTTETWYPR